MKVKSRILSLVLCVALMLSMATIAFAQDSSNVILAVDKTTAGVGDEVVVTLTTKAMTVSSFTCGVAFDKTKLECKSIVGSDADYPDDIGINKASGKSTWTDFTASSSITDANNNGTVGFGLAGAEDVSYIAETFVTITFTAIAEGSTSITLYEDTAGTNTYKSDSADSAVLTLTLPASTITITGDSSKTYDGTAPSDPAVTKIGSDGAVTYTYYTDSDCTAKTTVSGGGAASEGAAPVNAGSYFVKATVAANASYAAATSDAKAFTISRTAYTYTYSGATTATVGSAYPAGGTVQADGVNSENVDGTLAWFTNSACTTAASGTFTTAGTTDLWWKFTPAGDESNYASAAATSKVTFTVSAKDAAAVTFNNAVQDYTGSSFDLGSQFAAATSSESGGTIKYYYDSTEYASLAALDAVKLTNAGTYTVKAVYEDATHYGEKEATFTINKIDPQVSDFTITLPGSGTTTYTGSMQAATIAAASGISGMGTVSVTYNDSTTLPKDAGSYTVTFDVAEGTNYNAKTELAGGTITINQAAAVTLADQTVSQKYTVTSEQSKSVSGLMPSSAGTLTYTKGTESITGTVTVSSWAVDASGNVTFTLSGGVTGAIVTLPVTISSTNYATSTVNVIITLTEKDAQAALSITSGTTLTYDSTLALSTSGGSGTGAVTYTVTNDTGAATVDNETGILTPTQAGTVQIKAAKAADDNYNEVESASVTITINKATPTGSPAYTKITTSNKTLSDAALGVGTITPDGTIKWVDGDGNDLDSSTVVSSNTSYKWLFTPTDTTNYNTLSGSVTLYSISSGGGSHSYTYILSFNVNGGSAISSISKSSGTTVDLSDYETTKTGYTFDGWYSDTKLTTEVTSIKLTENTTIYAKWSKTNIVFTDVPDKAYYKGAVDWAVSKNITKGTSDTTFDPNVTCTRAQMITFLWRASGSPVSTSKTCAFEDLNSGSYYYDAVLWATENGITSGTSDTTFSPDDTVTRSQIIAFLWRADGSPATDASNPFGDVNKTAYYYKAVLWAAKNAITSGTGDNTFSPDAPCTRAQIVTFLYRYLGE